MRKFIALILVALLSVSLLAACSPSFPELSDSKAQEISDKLQSEYPQGLVAWSEPKKDDRGTLRYYGTYEGYDILFYCGSGMLAAISGKTIGKSSFSHPQSFSLLAYKDGEFRSLEEIYDEGLISDESVAKAADTHREYSKIVYSYTDAFDSFDWN